MGYSLAGFEIVGVDIEPQPRYPFEFHQADAFEYLAAHGHEFAAIHASPPCQAYSIMRNLPWLREKDYPRLIDPVREALKATGLPYIIENVMGAHLPAGWLCGTMFGRPFYRHRAFETNWAWMQPGHPRHQYTVRNGRTMGARARDVVFEGTKRLGGSLPKSKGKAGLAILEHADARGEASWPNRRESPAGNGLTLWFNGAAKRGAGVGHAAGVAQVREAMQIDWMTREELTQAIPPVFTRWIGTVLLRHLEAAHAH